ncbi:heparinase II/III domain-containing protein [Paenibacillus cremeus]|uniref:Alginate lyase family protein n=1 Tax=Paenibacillus cremeus TaxID=2163881 RepID=A0A559K3N3_9BACL|nr:heparinase II/III family protein [Paenibacillus cremeus]TVY06744.1 alginate lyase family protein [Paenibacillus cremeus]
MSTQIGEKRNKTGWAATLLQKLKQEIDELAAAGSLTIPSEPGGWWHQYVCPVHHAELLFNPLDQDAHEFYCPHGCKVDEPAYRGAWLVFKHQSLARAALQAAAVYAGTRDDGYASIAKHLVVEYARQFPHYPVHPDAQPWMLKGRAFHQALTEGIWSTTLLRALLLLKDEGVAFTTDEQEAVDQFLTMLESSMTEYRQILIYERKNPENNYTAWLNASLSCVYAVRGERESLLGLIEGEGGWRHHLSIGVKADQLEFEGSTYYHIFVLRAYLISAEMAQRFGIDLYTAEGTEGQTMSGMFDALVSLADDQGVIPALHDGPMERLPFAREIAEILEIGLTNYGKQELVPLLAEAYRQLGSKTGERCDLEALLYGASEGVAAAEDCVSLSGLQAQRSRASRLLAPSGFVVGRHDKSKLSFLADFGPHGGSHGHYDKLHVSIMHRSGAFTPDFGMVPYGSSLRKTWFAETASHNTVSLDGISQAEHEGRCVRFEETEEATAVWLQTDGAYPGCRMDRHLRLTEQWLLDWFEVKLEQDAAIEWWMHPIVEALDLASQLEPADPDASYELRINNEQRSLPLKGSYVPSADGLLQFTYQLKDGSKLYHSALQLPGTEAYAIHTPGNSIDPSKPLTALLQVQRGLSGRFIHVYSTKGPVALTLTGSELRVECESIVTTLYMSEEMGLNS